MCLEIRCQLEKEPVPKRTSSLSELELNPGVQIPSISLLPAVTTKSTDQLCSSHTPNWPGRGWQPTPAPYFITGSSTENYCITPACIILIFVFYASSLKRSCKLLQAHSHLTTLWGSLFRLQQKWVGQNQNKTEITTNCVMENLLVYAI